MAERTGLTNWIAQTLDWLQRVWPIIAFVFGSATVTAWATAASKWVSLFGPIAWVLGAFAGGFLALGFYWLMQEVIRRRLINRIATHDLGYNEANPLDKEFDRKEVHLERFFHPFYSTYSGQKFTRCRILGPSFLYLTGAVIMHNEFTGVQVAIIQHTVPVLGVIHFDGPLITNCELCNITLAMTAADYQAAVAKGSDVAKLPIITDGLA